MSSKVPQRQHTVKRKSGRGVPARGAEAGGAAPGARAVPAATIASATPSAAASAAGLRTPEGDLFSLIVTQVMQLHGLLTMAGDAMAKPAGQTAARWWVLGVVGRAPSSVAQVARALRLARQSVQRVADVLVAEGCAVYRANPRHRRAKLMQLTARGRSTLARIQAVQRTWADAIGAEVGQANLRSASAAMARLLRALQSIHP